MGSVFDAPPGVMKGNGQVMPTDGGNYNAPQQGAPQPVAPPQAGGPAPTVPGGSSDPGMIASLIAAVAKAFAPKSITQAGKRTEQGIAQGEGKDSLGGQF